MKKLSILLALVLALSCFSFVALAAPDQVTPAEESSIAKLQEEIASLKETTTEAKDPIDVWYKVIYSAAHPDDSFHDTQNRKSVYNDKGEWVNQRIFHYTVPAGTTLTPADIITTVKTTALNNDVVNKNANDEVDYNYSQGGSSYRGPSYEKPIMVIDGKEYTVNEKVFRGKVVTVDPANGPDYVQGHDVIPYTPESINTCKVDYPIPDIGYGFIIYAAEIDDVENFAQAAASALGGFQWGGIAKANVTLINEIIKGFNGAADSIAKDLPELSNKAAAANANNAVNGTTASSTSPATGASAIAGVAVVVLALASTTAVVLRKKED